MDVHHALPLLAGLTPAQFMRRHWQKKPLLVRGAIPGLKPLLSRAELVALASDEGVESRLIVKKGDGWRMKNGPFVPRSLPPFSQPGWTLLVQGVDGHHAAVHQLLQQFRFVPDARLDDVMISLASPGGGVGPHFDSYDVFLLQASGRRRWKISRQKDLTLQDGVPLKILQNFEPDEEFVLDAGDMLYLPPRYAHDGVAEPLAGAGGKGQDCMTYSIGFKAPSRNVLAAELLYRLADFGDDDSQHASPSVLKKMYSDPKQDATPSPAALPTELIDFAKDAVLAALKDPLAIACALGEAMTEPKAQVWFDEPAQSEDFSRVTCGLQLDAKTRMLYDDHHLFINGESYRAQGADARLMHSLADQRTMLRQALLKASPAAKELLSDWHAAGWLHLVEAPEK